MSAFNLAELRRLSEAATKGPWVVDDQGHYWSVREDGGGVVFDDGSACDEYEVFTWLRIRFSPIKPDFSRQSGKECGDYDRDMLVYLGTHRDRIVALLEAADGMEDALLDAVADCTENQPTYSAAIKAYRAAKGGA